MEVREWLLSAVDKWANTSVELGVMNNIQALTELREWLLPAEDIVRYGKVVMALKGTIWMGG